MVAASAPTAAASTVRRIVYEHELDDSFTGVQGEDGLMTIAGFGSLLSERSARFTFPDLQNFRPGKVYGWRRVFSHTADVFWKRGIARPETGEISSLSLEPWTPAAPAGAAAAPAAPPDACVVVSLFEVAASAASVEAFIGREHEFRFVAVEPTALDGTVEGRKAVICAANCDEDYRAMRCPPEEWARRWGVHGITAVWRSDVLPCRLYLRHCVLAARSLGPEAEHSFLHSTFLADRKTTIAEHLAANPSIMEEVPPPEYAARYSG